MHLLGAVANPLRKNRRRPDAGDSGRHHRERRQDADDKPRRRAPEKTPEEIRGRLLHVSAGVVSGVDEHSVALPPLLQRWGFPQFYRSQAVFAPFFPCFSPVFPLFFADFFPDSRKITDQS
ncbi:MAG: hypothetical protein MPJ83_02965 [Gammaproteobacteria bacterium]|nr:hypothetical protein [Gammaproteobacteria bacterium]